MNEYQEYVNPTQIPEINEKARDWATAGETIRPVEIKQIIISDNGIEALTDIFTSIGKGKRTLLVADRTPMKRGSDDLKAVIQTALESVPQLTSCTLPVDPQSALHADMANAEYVSRLLREHDQIISVGSGSITDIAKYARHLLAGDCPSTANVKPFISFPTAASVTAFTSALAVLMIDGVKRTLDALAPDHVVCDLQTLSDAPARMTQAGFGDVLARGVAYGDWYLANELGMDDGFSKVPGYLLGDSEQRMIDLADEVYRQTPAGIKAVTEAILLAGMGMSLVNQTAPVSGWEHVISHYLDLTAAGDGRDFALHGAQVGVGSLISARGYERAWGNIDATSILTDIDNEEYHKKAAEAFQRYDSNGKLLKEILSDLDKKISRWNGSAAARQRFVADLESGKHDEFIKQHVRPSSEISSALEKAGAPANLGEVTPPIPDSTALGAVRFCHLIRARFTFGDLLDKTGWLTQERAEALLS